MGSSYLIEIYQTSDEEYSWRCVSSSGQIVALSALVYRSTDDLLIDVESLQLGFQWSSIVDLGQEGDDAEMVQL